MDDVILLAHGSGGKKSHELVTETIVPHFENPILSKLDDQGIFMVGNSRVAMSTDSYVVDPIFFPGGDIGKLAVHGTVNDLAVCGARPLSLSVGFVLEEGFPVEDFERILASMGEAARDAGVAIVTGDTKVVPRGRADKIFINTSGVGVIETTQAIGGAHARPGDIVLINGTLADHGMAVMAAREGFETPIESDTAALYELIQSVLKVAEVHAMRDATRGGLATTIKEIALQSEVGILLEESKIPVKPSVASFCDLLGFDPLYVANEGKAIFFVRPEDAEKALATMQAHPLGKDARIIGKVTPDSPGKVIMRTAIGGSRVLEMLTGEQLPRIC